MSVAVTDYRSLISGLNWNGSQIVGQPIVLTYSFWPTLPYYTSAEMPAYVSTFAPMNQSEIAAIKAALSQWSSVSGVTFIESTKRLGDLNFSIVDMDSVGVDSKNVAGLGSYPSRSDYLDSNGVLHGIGDYRIGGDIWFGSDFRLVQWYESSLLNLALHEIGHALGLKHPHDVMAGHDEILSPDPDGSTVMSYKYQPGILGPLDIAAVQYLYGLPGGPADWTLESAKERFTFTGTSAGETIRGTAWDDIVYGNGGRDIISASMGNDRIYVGAGEVFAAGDDGVDIVFSSAKAGGSQGFFGDSEWSYLNLQGAYQTFHDVEYIIAADGLYNPASKKFVTSEIYSKFVKSYDVLTGSDAAYAYIEGAATSGKDIKTFIAELLSGPAKDSSIPALAVYDAMLGTTPTADHAQNLSAFVYNQIYSAGYQATPNPRLGGYEAMGLALAELAPVILQEKGKNDVGFVIKAYDAIFGRGSTAAQTTHFVGQVDYFEALYRGVGMTDESASLKARGAAYGQMIGYAIDETGNPLFADSEQSLLGYLKAAGVADWLA